MILFLEVALVLTLVVGLMAISFCLGAMYENLQGRKSLERLQAESDQIRREWDALEHDIREGMRKRGDVSA